MVFVACGLNHKTAPLAIREQIALPADLHDQLLHQLVDLPTVNEAAILSTCNRTEIYCDTHDPKSIVPWLAKEQGISTKTLLPYMYVHQGHHGVRHTLRVASGLDSMMIGEPQILGQMKEAYQQACRVGTVKQQLRPVFEYIFRASKRVRNGSGIGNNPVSIAFAAVQLIGQTFAHYETLRVLIIGTGETASLVAKYLHQQGVRHFTVASRGLENAERLATPFGGVAVTINALPQYLPQTDIVISATSCPLPFINQTLIQHAMQQRQQAPMFLLDLAVPRDIEAEVALLPNIHLYNIDDLQNKIDQSLRERHCAAQQAEQLIDHELENYIRWHRGLQSKQMICDYRQRMQRLTQLELKRAQQKLAQGACQQIVLTELSTRLFNKLTHAPTVGLRQAASDSREELLELAQYLFNTASYEKNA